jgi:DNA-binding MarR family transcriptional regulator
MSTAKTLKKESSSAQAVKSITLSAVVTTADGFVREPLLQFINDGIPQLALHNAGVESDEIILRVALARVQAKLWSIINSVMSGKTRITVTQWQVLKIISENPGVGCSAISQKLALLGPSLSRVLNALESSRLIKLKTADDDKRNKRITNTASGTKLVNKGNEALR